MESINQLKSIIDQKSSDSYGEYGIFAHVKSTRNKSTNGPMVSILVKHETYFRIP